MCYYSVCWSCHENISSDHDEQCPRCGWYICSNCGACSWNGCIGIYEKLPEKRKEMRTYLAEHPDVSIQDYRAMKEEKLRQEREQRIAEQRAKEAERIAKGRAARAEYDNLKKSLKENPKVIHSVYGAGEVVGFRDNGPYEMMMVDFWNGRKTFTFPNVFHTGRMKLATENNM